MKQKTLNACHTVPLQQDIPRSTIRIAFIAALVLVSPPFAAAQIVVTNNNGSGLLASTGTIGEYNVDGTTVNAALLSGLDVPKGIAVSGANLFVVESGIDHIGEYTIAGAPVNPVVTDGAAFPTSLALAGTNLYVASVLGSVVGKFTTFGATVNDSLITDFNGDVNNGPLATGIAVSADGSRLFIANNGDNTIGDYDSVTGATINAALVTGLNHPTGLAISGNSLYVANSGNGTIGKYNLDGTPVNPSFITGLSNPLDLADFGGNLYVVNNGTNSIGEYDATTGATINTALISGLNDPQGIAIVPEPATLTLVATGTLGLLGFRRRVRQTVNIPGAASPQPIKYKHEITEIANGAKNSNALEIRRPQRAPVSNFLVEEQVFAR